MWRVLYEYNKNNLGPEIGILIETLKGGGEHSNKHSEERGGGVCLVPLYCTVYNISLKIKVFLLTVALLLSNRNIELLKERNGRLSARR